MMNRYSNAILASAIFVLGTSSFYLPRAQAAGPNLVANPGFESSVGGLPSGWIRGKWGTNTTVFSYPVAGRSGQGAAVAMTQRTTGDAKWAFDYVSATAGKQYEYSDYYKANVPTIVTVEFLMNDGSRRYSDLAELPAQANFSQSTFRFTAPSEVQSVRVFHLLNRVGSLTIDDVSLSDVGGTPPPTPDPSNLIPNPSLEITTIQGTNPENWSRGRWGTNSSLFTYPVAAFAGSKAARVELSSYSSGDAKWYFNAVAVDPSTIYTFANSSRSSINSYVTVQFKHANGTFSYRDLKTLPASSSWQQFSQSFETPPDAVGLTVFHLIKGNGWLEIDNYSLKRGSGGDPTRFLEGIVSLTFDDGWLSAFQNAIPLLNQNGFKSTNYIVSERLDPGFSAYIHTDEVLTLQAQGHEIGAHTRTHADLSQLTVDEQRAEISGSRSDLLAAGVNNVNSFAYPFGVYSPQIKQLVQDAGYTSARTTDDGDNLKTADRFALKRQSMEVDTSLGQVQGYIDQAVNDRSWLILNFHEVNTSGRQYSITPNLFGQIVSYLKQKGVKVSTITQTAGLLNQ